MGAGDVGPAGGRVAYQGEPGAYGEQAAQALYGASTELLPRPGFRAVFEAVWSGEASRAVVPLENSTAGLVAEPCQLLLERPVFLHGELALPIRHCLLALPGVALEDLEAVWSHPQALAQCEAFLRRRSLRGVTESDTAGSARLLAERRPPRVAAIASRAAAERYGLAVLAEDIQTVNPNLTRFVVVADRERLAAGRKCTLAFALSDRVGALADALAVLARHGLQLTRLISLPLPGDPWKSVFQLDAVGALAEQERAALLAELSGRTTRLWTFGSY